MTTMERNEYHHYIPKFILRNFAIENFNQNQTKKKEESLQIYDRAKDRLGISPIARTYGGINMYKDLNHDDTMHVERKLANLEEKASKVVKDIIIEASQTNGKIILLRKNLADLCKFLFIMNYRNPYRKIQFTNNDFDIITRPLVERFMQEHNLNHPQEVWLQNVREILDTPHEDVQNNLKIFPIDRTDYELRMKGCFLAIWQAGKTDEFIMTTNAFGIFEGITVTTPMGPVHKVFHWFFVISPKVLLVLCDFGFKEGIGFDTFYGHRSIFKNVSHPQPILECVNNSQHESIPDSNPDDKFTFTFVKVKSATVHLVNSILLNEATPDLQVSFLSLSYLYKTLVKYNKSIEDTSTLQDFSNMKKTLFRALNRIH
ncbi:hypothetical protein F8M41_023331 [Gigaspora margarita]|uniref:DUF4238 domain-containing protein n=1 Tax=Gigaspora margarita TaxID=4874 RepID=A0A8H4ADJ8_GIGMA|nr:hypothetical protein F8M41_023331 [Gigaspora margarita]